MKTSKLPPESATWRQKLHEVIFEADTLPGKAFDVTLLVFILISVLVVILESIPPIHDRYGEILIGFEWGFTILFTIEYILRILSVRDPLVYSASFYGLVDLLSILPTYLSILIPGGHYLLVIRILRLLRVFRIFKLAEYLTEANELWRALVNSRRKIGVFLVTVVTLVIIIGALMYVIEGAEHGFTDIPTSIYWAVVTLTTVGYGDLAPQTPFGQFVASLVMLLGYAIIAVPTGIVTAEIARGLSPRISTQACPTCGRQGHDYNAIHCKFCGSKL